MTEQAFDTPVTEDTQPAEEARIRVSYTQDASKQQLTVKYDKEVIEFPVGEELYTKHAELRDHLALVGLTSFFQRETSKVRDAEKLDAIEKAYDRLMTEGMGAFKRKAGGGPRGPRKADKIAALAALKGATTAAIEKKLATMDKAKQEDVLNHPKVLAKLEEMKSDSDGLDLNL